MYRLDIPSNTDCWSIRDSFHKPLGNGNSHYYTIKTFPTIQLFHGFQLPRCIVGSFETL